MAGAKEIRIEVIPANVARDFVRKHHYSGKVVNNSKLHFGAFVGKVLHGVMSLGSPLDKRKVLPLVHTSEGKPCLWNEMLELNRMAFDDVLPKNSESRAIAVAMKLIRKNAPHIKWVLSFADATQCGDGAIYRASGFALTGIVENCNTCEYAGGVIHKMTLESNPTSARKELNGKSYYDLTGANMISESMSPSLAVRSWSVSNSATFTSLTSRVKSPYRFSRSRRLTKWEPECTKARNALVD